ncbi:MAG: flagellar protein FliS [Lachnospiraceae bacterium]|jgi:flagellar protein FliS|nr:flagellar protein FliS [Lachnospiraceae bacterium]
MQKEAIQAFTARITQASKSELIVILYEMILTEIKEAEEAFEREDLEAFDKDLKQAQKYLGELMAALDYRYKLAYNLSSLYQYVNKRIITAMIQRKPDSLESAVSVLQKLLTGFEGVSKEDTSGPMMRNTQQLYAGLTYGKGTLNETYIDPNDRSRGFIV